MKATKLTKTYNIIIRSFIIVISLAFLIYQLFIKQDFSSIVADFKSILQTEEASVFILLCIALMPLNWSLEALKWKYLLKGKEYVSFFLALKAVLCGATISAVSPNRTGDYFARVFVLKHTHFWKGVFITLIGSYSQTITTLLFGGLAFFSLFAFKLLELNYVSHQQLMIFQSLFLASIVVLSLLYFRISVISSLIPERWKKIHMYVSIFRQYSFVQLISTLGISILRYLTFSMQYYLVLLAVGITELSLLEGFAVVSAIFMLNTIRPSIALLELGIRGSVALFIFGLYYGFDSSYDAAVFSASTLIWLINIILPALLGLFFIKDLRFIKAKRK